MGPAPGLAMKRQEKRSKVGPLAPGPGALQLQQQCQDSAVLLSPRCVSGERSQAGFSQRTACPRRVGHATLPTINGSLCNKQGESCFANVAELSLLHAAAKHLSMRLNKNGSVLGADPGDSELPRACQTALQTGRAEGPAACEAPSSPASLVGKGLSCLEFHFHRPTENGAGAGGLSVCQGLAQIPRERSS